MSLMQRLAVLANGKQMLVLDGALATQLERKGADLRDPLWSAKILIENPQMIYDVHMDYFRSGADFATTASYQATVEGFAARGISKEEGMRLIQRSVDIACRARDDFWNKEGNGGRIKPFIAGSIGPYGAYLANGAEYTGDYDVDEAQLIDFHRTRVNALVSAGVEVLACETIPSLSEAKAIVSLLSSEFPHTLAWFSFSCRDEERTNHGELIEECALALAPCRNVVAIGVNCTAPSHLTSLVKAIRSVTDKRIVVYPNSGEIYDSLNKVWFGDGSPERYLRMAKEWRSAGASIIGGCCRTTPLHIEYIRNWLQGQQE